MYLVELIVPKIHKKITKESTMGLYVKTKRNGYAVTNERAKELKERFPLFGYTSDIPKVGEKTPILLHNGFSDAFEIIEFFGLNPSDCVVVLGAKAGYQDPLTETAICPNNLAGVLDPFRNDRKVFFPDGISENTILYNVRPIDKKCDLLDYSDKQYELFTIPTKIELFQVIFGKKEREKNKRLEKYLLSLETYIKKDYLYFYLTMYASKETKENLQSFANDFLRFSSETISVSNAKFDFEAFYSKIAESNDELKEILETEQKRILFVNQFPRLKKLLDSGDYRYIPINQYKDTFNSKEYLWFKLFQELEIFFKEGFANEYTYGDDFRIFNYIAEKMIFGELSDDNERISFVNFDSSKSIVNQLEKYTTFTFVKDITIDSQNEKLKIIAKNAVKEEFEETLEKELKTGLIKSKSYEILGFSFPSTKK